MSFGTSRPSYLNILFFCEKSERPSYLSIHFFCEENTRYIKAKDLRWWGSPSPGNIKTVWTQVRVFVGYKHPSLL